jgi:TFIIH basal transcription factor complex TTD-A subunit
MPNAHKYNVDMLDDIHIYVHHHVFEMVTKKLQEFHNQNTYEGPCNCLWVLDTSFAMMTSPLQVVLMFVKMCKATLGMMVH